MNEKDLTETIAEKYGCGPLGLVILGCIAFLLIGLRSCDTTKDPDLINLFPDEELGYSLEQDQEQYGEVPFGQVVPVEECELDFDDYPVETELLASANFAGNYSLEEVSCEDEFYCTRFDLIDLNTDEKVVEGFTGVPNIEFRADSNLLVVNPRTEILGDSDYDFTQHYTRDYYAMEDGVLKLQCVDLTADQPPEYCYAGRFVGWKNVSTGEVKTFETDCQIPSRNWIP